MHISVIVRTLNEELYLEELLRAISTQELVGHSVDCVVVDSGSTDRTLSIAKKHGCEITSISKYEFTFGRSLNRGCSFAKGDILVFISGHCVPCNELWLSKLVTPLITGEAQYSYGRQVGRDTTKFSEERVFEKYYPPESDVPQAGFFCNNANAAILRTVWKQYEFDEEVTGLEDMYLARQISENGGHIAYIGDATVYHIHDESWSQTKRRYEREALALKVIMPEIQFGIKDFLFCYCKAVLSDLKKAIQLGQWPLRSVLAFRLAQYFGTLVGSSKSSKESLKAKRRYYYPSVYLKEQDEQASGFAPNESKQ